MKKIYLLLALLWFASVPRVFAQKFAAIAPAPVDSVRQYLSNMFANVDKTQIPAPYLEEYGYRFLPLRLFNGALVDSSRTTLTLWRQLYATVVSGNINGPDDLPALADLNTQIRAQTAASGAIPLVIQRLDYAALRPDAIQAGLLTGRNDQLFDVPNRPASPYLLKTLFAASPARNVAATGNVSFVFTQALHVQSGGGIPLAISLDFGDGRGYVTAAWGQPITTSYSMVGTKRVKVKVTYSTMILAGLTKPAPTPTLAAPTNPPIVKPPVYNPPPVSYESQFDLQVLDPAVAATLAAKPAAGIGTVGTNGTSGPNAVEGYVYHGGTDSVYFAPNANHSGGWAYLVYGGKNRNYLTKPLIVAEGYDVSHIAPDIQSNYSVRNFLQDIVVSNGNSVGNYFTFFYALGHDAAATANTYATTAYDLVFIDYNNGTDDIRRNAALFKEVVQYVNAHKQGGTATGQQNVVLGISMGGLVARYGLAQMEKAQPGSTHTRLLVTHDSPHRGANTPLGLQALTRQSASTYLGMYIRAVNSSGIPHLLSGGDIFPELQQADLLLDEPATKQLLLVRATVQRYLPFAWASSYGVEYNSFVDGEYRNVITPPAGGFPYHFIATSLGSQCGKATLAPYDELVRVEEGAFLLGAGTHTQIVVNALPNPGQVQRLSGLRVWLQVRVAFFTHKFYLSRLDYQSPANNPIAWDGLPGGTQAVNGQLTSFKPGNTSGSYLLGIVGYYKNVALANAFCFVPSASALDVTVLDNNTARASYVNGFTSSTSPLRAENFIAGTPFVDQSGRTAYNYSHPSFTGRYGQWIYNEMERPFNGNTNSVACDPSPECNPLPPLVITGPSNVCGPATYSVPTIAGATYSWTTSPAGAFSPATGSGPTFTTTATGPGNGQVAVAVVSPCPANSFTAALPVAVCNPLSVAITSLVYTNACTSSSNRPNYAQWTAQASGGTGPYTYAWYLDYGGTGTYQGPAGSGATFGLCLNGYSRLVVAKVVVTSGNASAEAVYYAQPQSFAVYPNPASDYVEVASTVAAPSQRLDAVTPAAKHTSAASEVAGSAISAVRIYDSYGKLWLEQPGQEAKTVRLRVGALPAGFYVVHILSGGAVVSRQQLKIER